MEYNISKNYIKTVISTVEQGNAKLKKFPTSSEITYKFTGEYYVPSKKKDSNVIVPLHMWKLTVDYDIKSRNLKYIGLLSVKNNGYYAIETVDGKKVDCPYYWVSQPLKCDCCKVATNRKYSYIVKDTLKDFQVQLGKECLNKHTSSRMLEEIGIASKVHEAILLYNDLQGDIVNDFISLKFLALNIVSLYERNGDCKELADYVSDAILKESVSDQNGDFSLYYVNIEKSDAFKANDFITFFKTNKRNVFEQEISEIFKYSGIKRKDISKVVNAYIYFLKTH